MDDVLGAISFILTIIYFALILYLLNSKFEARFSRVPSRLLEVTAVIAFLMAIAFLSVFFEANNLLLLSAVGLVIVLYLLIARKGPLLLKFFWFIISLAFFGIAQTAASAFAILAFGLARIDNWNMLQLVLIALVADIILAISVCILARKGNRITEMSPMALFLLSLTSATSCFILVVWTDYSLFPPDADQLKVVLHFVAAIGIALINFAVFALYEYMSREAERNLEQQRALQEAELKQIYYDEISALYKETSGWKHDYANHLQAIKGYTLTKNHSALSDYLDGLESSLASMTFQVKSGNNLLDALVSAKMSYAHSKGIDFSHIEINTDVSSLPFESVEITTLFGNLLDNAIEACQRIEDPSVHRFIELEIKQVGTNTALYIKNSTAKQPVVKHNAFVTSKKSPGHGIGMKQIQKTVEKYGGHINYQEGEGTFTVLITLSAFK